MKVALIQMVSSTKVEINLKEAEKLIREAVSESEFIFLPENFAALGNGDLLSVDSDEISLGGRINSFLREIAERHSCWLFAGTFPISSRPDGSVVSGGRVRAASLVLNPEGEVVSRYDKIHMFDAVIDDNQGSYTESKIFEPGDSVTTLNCPLGRMGLTVCYDIRFPELYRRLFAAEVDLIAVPSAFTENTGKAHFELLMRARAVENCCYMVAACQGGIHDSGRRTWGHSMVVDPWGRIVGELGKGPGILFVEIDQNIRKQLRSDMPFHLHQRLPN